MFLADTQSDKGTREKKKLSAQKKIKNNYIYRSFAGIGLSCDECANVCSLTFQRNDYKF